MDDSCSIYIVLTTLYKYCNQLQMTMKYVDYIFSGFPCNSSFLKFEVPSAPMASDYRGSTVFESRVSQSDYQRKLFLNVQKLPIINVDFIINFSFWTKEGRKS